MASKYIIKNEGGNHVVITVDSGDLTTSLGTRRFLPRGLSAAERVGAIDLKDEVNDDRVFSALPHGDIYKDTSGTVWGATAAATVTALNAFFATSPHDLEDLQDVPSPTDNTLLKYTTADGYAWTPASSLTPAPNEELNDLDDVTITSLTDDQILQYNSSTSVWENVDFPNTDTTLSSSITITNTDAAFSHMSSPIASGTSLEQVVRNILEKYNLTSITFSSFSAALESTSSTYGSPTTSTGATLEIGRGVKIHGFNYSVGDPTQTTDDSVKFIQGSSTVIESGFADDATSATLASVITLDPGTASSTQYKLTVIDSGGGSDVTRTSVSRGFSWQYRVRVGAHSTSSITSDSEAAALWALITDGYNNIRSESDFTISATSAMNTALNYTWIAYPAAWGNLNQVLLDGSTNVLSDFQSPVDYNITNDYGLTASYRFYRSTYDQAFSHSNPTQLLTIDF
jgi:hypothetical protein